MSELVFTEYVRCIAAGHQPSAELHERFWRRFRGALVHEMKTRSIWSVPPGRLCFVAGSSWSSSEEALEELLHDCFISVLLERLQGLAAQLKVKPDVEGLVFRNLKNFLTALQKRFDPVGYRVYERLRDTVCRAVDEGRMDVLEGGRKIDNRTLLGISSPPNGKAATAGELMDHAGLWADDLLPDLLLAGGSRQKARVLERLAAHLDRLADAGIRIFRFKALADALKAAVRPRWHALRVAQGGNIGFEETSDAVEVVRLVPPDAQYEDREAYGKLLACMDEKLERHEAKERTREYLYWLWDYVKIQVAEDEHDRPGRRQLSRLLGIPRDRFPELEGILRLWLDVCRRACGGKSRL